MRKIILKDMTERQRQAWQMRYHYGWRLRKISVHLGIKPNSVSELLARAMRRAGLPHHAYVRIIRSKGRRVRAIQLSTAFNY